MHSFNLFLFFFKNEKLGNKCHKEKKKCYFKLLSQVQGKLYENLG